MTRPFTQTWADQLQSAINESDTYRDAGESWEWPVALILEATPDLDYPEDVAVLLDLIGGRCDSARVVPIGDVDAPFTIRGRYDIWKRVIQRDLDPIAAIIQGKLQLTGNLGTVVRHVSTAQALVDCAATLPTSFPDDPSP